MTEKTYDMEDPGMLPYRFTYSPVTGEVYVISLWRGFNVSMVFENREAFHRFLSEGQETEHKIVERSLFQSEEILKAKQTKEG